VACRRLRSDTCSSSAKELSRFAICGSGLRLAAERVAQKFFQRGGRSVFQSESWIEDDELGVRESSASASFFVVGTLELLSLESGESTSLDEDNARYGRNHTTDLNCVSPTMLCNSAFIVMQICLDLHAHMLDAECDWRRRW
jgi:hypothetical protein